MIVSDRTTSDLYFHPCTIHHNCMWWDLCLCFGSVLGLTINTPETFVQRSQGLEWMESYFNHWYLDVFRFCGRVLSRHRWGCFSIPYKQNTRISHYKNNLTFFQAVWCGAFESGATGSVLQHVWRVAARMLLDRRPGLCHSRGQTTRRQHRAFRWVWGKECTGLRKGCQ